jgi:hypothetical protein
MERLPDEKREVIEKHFGYSLENLLSTTPEYGHMAYSRFLIEAPDGRQAFAKVHLPENYVIRDASERAFVEAHSHNDLEYLKGEARNLAFVNRHAPGLAPELYAYENGVMLMQRLDGAKWWLPDEKYLDQYVHDCFSAFDRLSSLPADTGELNLDDRDIVSLRGNGWAQIDPERIQLAQLNLPRLCEIGAEAVKNITIDTPSHHDSRQTNIAWWEDRSSKLVDLSWFNLGPRNTDSTMLLIDLAKYGHDIRRYMPGRFNEAYAWLRAGNWLNRATLPPSAPEREKVRQAQLKSALAALRLLEVIE